MRTMNLRRQIVQHADLMSFCKQMQGEAGSDESRAACNKYFVQDMASMSQHASADVLTQLHEFGSYCLMTFAGTPTATQ